MDGGMEGSAWVVDLVRVMYHLDIGLRELRVELKGLRIGLLGGDNASWPVRLAHLAHQKRKGDAQMDTDFHSQDVS